jgi:hypothetical protein
MALPQTKRQKIFDRVLNRLHNIRSDNEPDKYNTQVGRHVFPWRTGYFSEEELASFEDTAALVVRDVDETKAVNSDHTKPVTERAKFVTDQKFERELHMQIEIVQSGETSPSTIRQIIADIETAIRQDIRWRDESGKALALGTRPRIDRSVVEQESKKVSGVIYEFFVHYATDAFNSYT